MKIEYKENLYRKYLKQRYMALLGWVHNYKIDKDLFIEHTSDCIKKLESINDIEKLETMLFNLKRFFSITEEQAKEILKLK